MNQFILGLLFLIYTLLIVYFKNKNNTQIKEHQKIMLHLLNQINKEQNIKNERNDLIHENAKREEKTQNMLTAIQLKLEFLHLISTTNLS